ncbi:MAG: hypothetical protein J0L84_18015 [Verrucomicrobia bacterium]|nr:hypothetical protein [Verrucomicrobiota bacterium]
MLAAERFGKHKTISQIVAILAVLLLQAVPRWGPWLAGPGLGGHSALWWLAEVSQWVAVALTVFSGAVYLWKNRRLYLEDL